MEEKVCKECNYYDPYPCSNACTYPHKKHGSTKDNPMGNPEAFTYCYYLKQKGKRVPRYYEDICKNCGEVFSRHECGVVSGHPPSRWNGDTEYCNKCRPRFESPKPLFTFTRDEEEHIMKAVKAIKEREETKYKPVEPESRRLEDEIYVRPKRRYVLGARFK